MAIIKSIDTQYGVVASYWKVSTLNVDWHNKRCELVMAGYADEQAREDGKNPIEFRWFNFFDTDFYLTFDGNNVQESYDRLDHPIFDSNGNDINVFQGATDLQPQNRI